MIKKDKEVTKNKKVEEKVEKVVKEKAPKKPNKVCAWFSANKITCGVFVLGLVVGVGAMLIINPTRIPKLKNGEEVVVEVKNKKFTADDLYNKLKTANGLTTLLSDIDEAILKDKYKDVKDEAEKYSKEQSEYYYNMYSQMYGYTKEQFLEANGFTEESFHDYWVNEYYYSHYYEEYLENLVDEKDVEKEYKTNYFADRNVYVFSAEKKDNSLEDVIKALKKGTDVSKVASKYESKGINMVELGTVGYSAIFSYSEDFYNNVKKLNKGGVSKVFEDSSYGYTVIYVSKVEEAKSEKEAKKEIRSVLGQKLDEKDDKLYYKAVFDLRESYGIKFSDKELKKAYEDFKKKNTETTTTTTTTTKKTTKKASKK